MSVEVIPFGTYEGQQVHLFRIENANGMRAAISNYGGVVTELHVPDREGRLADVVLGYDSLDGYLGDGAHLGALIGRYGNRIANGHFEIEGKGYPLAKNNGPNHLHGGTVGYDRCVWDGEPTEAGVKLSRVSPDGEEGYPGQLDLDVTIELTDEDTLLFSYRATTSATTHVNLTHHGYFNLRGYGDILDHEVTLHADRFTPVDDGLIPTGELRPVEGTPFDFRGGERVGSRIEGSDPQLVAGGGYDHNWVLSKEEGAWDVIAKVREPESGRTMEVLTSEPGVQFYTGNFLDGSIIGKNGIQYERRSGLCLETQHFPDSPNKPSFPSTLLRPDENYASDTAYRFSVE